MPGSVSPPALRHWCAGAMLMLVHAIADAASPELTITGGGRTQRYTPEALLAHPAVTTITIPDDVAYKRPMTYRAVPMSELLSRVAREESLRFAASDGFAATLPAAPLLATSDDAARAYLAVESSTRRWPALRAGSPATAGPFYLVWLRPEKSRIAPEQWPYQVATVEALAPVTTRFPALLPASTVSSTDPIRRGLTVYTTHCIVCHTLNLAGDAKIGPDLNVPFSPTEYLREEHLRRQIRNPASLRVWDGQRMPGFASSALSDREMDDLIAYLYHMAKRKVELPAAR